MGIGPEYVALMIPLLMFMIPIVAILTSHQRKMAEIIHQGKGQNRDYEIAALRQEIAELKSLVHQQAISMDSFLSSQAKLNPPVPPSTVQERLLNS